MARNRDWLYETPKQESLRLRLWREAAANAVPTRYRQRTNGRVLIKRESSEEIQMLLNCIKAHKEKQAATVEADRE